MKLSVNLFVKKLNIKFSLWTYQSYMTGCIKIHFFQESYSPRMVNSLYFDTPNYDFASSNMSGESKRIKLRARWYGGLEQNFLDSFLQESQLFNFEAKRKSNSFSDKLNIGELSYDRKDNYSTRINSIQDSLESM